MSQNMTLRLFFPVVVLAGFFNTAKCQNGEAWTMRVEVTNNDVCGLGRSFAGSNTSITYGGVTQNSSDGTTFFSASFADADGIFSDNPLETTDDILITTSVDCFCSNPMVCAFSSITTQTINGNIPVTHIPSDGNCRTILQTIGSDKVSVVITFIKTMNQPTVDPPNSITGFCENSTLALSTTSTASASGYKWYVAEGTGSTYHEITGKTTQTINVNANDLNKPGFTTATRKIRVEDAGCGGSSAPSNQFTIYTAPPTSASLVWEDPRCFGEDNGTVTINSVTGSVSNYTFTLEYYETTTSTWGEVYQQSFAISALPVTIDKAKILIFDDESPHAIKAGQWRMHVANNVSKDVLGTCSIKLDKTIVEPTPLSATLTNVNSQIYNGNGVKCNGDTNGSISVSASGGNPGGYTYLWSNSSTGTSISNLAAGTYSITVTDSKGCTSSPTLALDPPDPLALSITTTKTPSCNESADGQLTAIPVGGVSPYTYLWSNSQTNSLAIGFAKGIHSVTVTDNNGCTINTNNDLGAPAAIVVLIDGTPPTCANGDNGRVWVTDVQNEPSATLQYSWDTGDDTYEALNLSQGTYTVTVTSPNGGVNCTGTANKTIVDPQAWSATLTPVLAYNGAAISCNGQSNGRLDVTLRNHLDQVVSGEYFTWSTGANGPSVNYIDQLAEGMYCVTVLYNGICEATASYNLNDPDPVSAIVTISSNYNDVAITCPGVSDGSLHAVGGGGTGSSYSFVWNTGTVGADLTGKSAGSYTVIATDANGCTGLGDGRLDDPAPINPEIDITSNYNGLPIKCHNSIDAKLHANSTGGAGTISYVWNTGATGSNLDDVGAGNYTVIATDANGCTMNASKIVINPDPVIASIAILSEFNGQAISCHNASDGSLKASGVGGTNSFSYSWSTGASGSNLSGVPSGNYSVEVVDMNGCSDTENETLINPDLVEALITDYSDFNGYGVRCKNSIDGFIEAAGQGGTGSYNFLWMETLETTSSSTNLSAGMYTIKVTDTNGCFDTKSHTVIEPAPLTIGLLTSKNISCFDGNDGELNVIVGGGVALYQYSINSITSWQASSLFTTLKAETPYAIRVKDLNGCTKVLNETLTQPLKLEVSFAIEPAFCADPRGAATAMVAGGTGGYIYEWKDAAAIVISTTTSIHDKPAGVYNFLVHDSNGCPLEKSVGIVSTDGPQVDVAESTAAKCSYSADGSATLEVVEGDTPFTYLWPNGQTTSHGTGLARGLYYVTITDVNDCVSTKEVEISAPDVLTVTLAESINPSCYGDCNGSIRVQTVGGTGAYTYAWNNQVGDEIATDLCTGDYSVVVTDANACTDSAGYILNQPELLQLQVKERKLPLCNGDCNGSIEVNASGGNGNYEYVWSSQAATPMATSLCAGDHIVMVKDSKNCSLERTISLGQPEQLKVKLLRNQAPICHDGCNGDLAVESFGGTGTHTYLWNTGSTSANLSGLCSADYTVNITDVNGCGISSTYKVENPPALVIDLGEDKTLCLGQTYLLDAGSSWAKYTWSSNTGVTDSTRQIIIKDAGEYSVEVENQDGCKAFDSFILETSIDLLQAEFFMAAEAMVGDTVVLVDVSWPLPESIVWSYPASMVKIFDYGPVVFGKFNDEGVYEITLTAALGECRDKMVKTITILKTSENPNDGKLGYKKFVTQFELYPNPNDGEFDVSIQLAEESPITLSVWSLKTSLNMGTWKDNGKSYYLKHIDLRPLGSGVYVLRFDHPEGYELIRFIVH